MRLVISLVSLFFIAINLYAEEEDIFADIDRMEIDTEYKDDNFGFENTKSQALSSSQILHPYDSYSERAWVRDEQSLGGLVSQETIARVYHMTLFPKARFKIWQLNTHVGLPMRFPIYDNLLGSSNFGSRRKGFVRLEDIVAPRGPDFRSFADAFKIIRQLSWGTLFEPYYFGLVREQAFTLGQGDLMREMATDYLYDQDYLFARAHASFDWGRFDLVSGPIPKVNIVGINAKIKPLANLNSHKLVQNMSFDLTYVGDYQAPGQAHKEEDAYVLEADRRLVKRDKNIAQGASLGVATLYEPISWFSSKPYVSFSNLWLTGLKNNSYGLAFNFGHDASINFSKAKDSVLFFRSEARLFSENYQPNYFGSNYMLDRVNLFESADDVISKAQLVGMKKDNKWRFGHMLELGYNYSNIVNTKLTYESARTISTNEPVLQLRKLRFATGVLAFDRVKFQGSFEANNIENLKDIFDFTKNRRTLALEAQVKILSFLYFDSWLKHSYGINNMYEASHSKEWLSKRPETRSLNFGVGLELAMAF